MARQPKNQQPDTSGEDLIQGAADRNTGHEQQTEATATKEEEVGATEGDEAQTPNLRTFAPNPEDVLPASQVAAQANLELPKMQETSAKPSLPLMVPESQVMTEADLQKAADDSPMFQNDPTNIAAADLHAQRLKTFGEDYVVVNKGKQQQVFTRHAWNSLKGDKFGWVEAVKVPAEVRGLGGK